MDRVSFGNHCTMKMLVPPKSRPIFIALFLIMLHSCSYGQEAQDKVCITRTGEKYHRCTCRYLRQSSFEIRISEATRRGYTACSVCRPPLRELTTETGGSSGAKTSQDAAPNNTTTQQQKIVKSRQCSAFTKSGSRCKRTTTNSNGRCWQHQ